MTSYDDVVEKGADAIYGAWVNRDRNPHHDLTDIRVLFEFYSRAVLSAADYQALIKERDALRELARECVEIIDICNNHLESKGLTTKIKKIKQVLEGK